jgi:hypothetical protein
MTDYKILDISDEERKKLRRARFANTDSSTDANLEAEKLKIRAQRFGVTSQADEKHKVDQRRLRFKKELESAKSSEEQLRKRRR